MQHRVTSQCAVTHTAANAVALLALVACAAACTETLPDLELFDATTDVATGGDGATIDDSSPSGDGQPSG